MPKTRQQKEEQVKSLTDKLSRAKSVVFADYKGLTTKQLSELRDKIRDQQAEFSITKNSLLKRAFPISSLREASHISLPTSIFQGPTAALFAYDDEISPLKIVVKMLKDTGIGKVKALFLGTEFLDEERIIQLSTLPTKDELRTKTVGVLVAPLQGLVGVLNGNLRNLVYALNQIHLQKGGDTKASS